jgi:hypothetical protein
MLEMQISLDENNLMLWILMILVIGIHGGSIPTST